MKKIPSSWLLAPALRLGACANEGGAAWDKFPRRGQRPAALQNGAKLFVNYCLNCHSPRSCASTACATSA